jgi:hypothetical protein
MPAQLEAGEVRQLLGGEAGGPLARRQLVLGEDLLGLALELVAVLGDAGDPAEVAVVVDRHPHRDDDQAEQGTRLRRAGDGHDERRDGEQAVQQAGVQLLAERGAGEHGLVGAVSVLGLDALPALLEPERGAAPDHGRDGAQEGDDRQDRLLHRLATLPAPGGGAVQARLQPGADPRAHFDHRSLSMLLSPAAAPAA